MVKEVDSRTWTRCVFFLSQKQMRIVQRNMVGHVTCFHPIQDRLDPSQLFLFVLLPDDKNDPFAKSQSNLLVSPASFDTTPFSGVDVTCRDFWQFLELTSEVSPNFFMFRSDHRNVEDRRNKSHQVYSRNLFYLYINVVDLDFNYPHQNIKSSSLLCNHYEQQFDAFHNNLTASLKLLLRLDHTRTLDQQCLYSHASLRSSLLSSA